uniref:Threonyl-tRNA synthetase n=2 Tax=Calcidiscus leptoporus TaxID=127549 RepID=A0A7S0J123_9EUKA|mmetsp:Transcript_33590/g.78585  ORF Transcript_33590/g.78585 Transcript_33590/m.78585 type:complete len:225 (+) Transcript_33590:2-676(+)
MLSTRPEKAVGSDEIWDKATSALESALARKDWGFSVDEGGGAFYGPKIDIKIKDAIGRLWQCSTVQCDFNLPERFGMEYVSAGGARERPIMVHRAIYGSIERFFGVLLESTAGDFPFWLAPVQLRLLPVSDDFRPFCDEVLAQATAAGLRAEIDVGGRSLSKQIKVANQEKIPILAVIGKDEVESRTLNLAPRKGGDLGRLPIVDAIARLAEAERQAVEPLDLQ